MGWHYRNFAPYVSVAKRKKQAAKEVEKLKKKGLVVQPVILEGRQIAKTFWGKAWCENLESYSDYESRLARGRTYVRNGSVIDLKVAKGEITALVSGSSIYKVRVGISSVVAKKWNNIVSECAGKIASLIEILQGKFSKAVMEIITNPERGLFPHPKEIKFNCSCPDWAAMCKHIAAVLYGVGARLDDRPEELFLLRQADHVELISQVGTSSFPEAATIPGDQILAEDDLSSLFGIDMGSAPQGAKIKNKISKAKKPKIPDNKKIKKPGKTKAKKATKKTGKKNVK